MDGQELAGRVALVTGAGRNIGRSMALALAAGGAAVVVNVRSNLAQGESVAKEIEAKGGKTVMPVTEIPGMVIFAQFADPEGNIVGMTKAGYPS